MRECVTHHAACDCREEKFAAIADENRQLKKNLQNVNDKLSDLMVKIYELRGILAEE